MAKNRIRTIRESQLLSKTALAKKAGVSVLTVTRVEEGRDCRIDTKRKIILALGFDVSEKDKVFEE